MFNIKDFFTAKLVGLSVEEINQQFHSNELKTYAKVLGIKNRSKMNKLELATHIHSNLHAESEHLNENFTQ